MDFKRIQNLDAPDLMPSWQTIIEEWTEEQRYKDRPELWGPCRTTVCSFVESKLVETLFALCITFNVFLMVLETDQTADGGQVDDWIKVADFLLLAFYFFEIAGRLFAWRLVFFFDGWNLLDFAVVSIDCFLCMIQVGSTPSLGFLRMVRLVKVGRALRALNIFPELRILLRSAIGAFRAMIWGLILIGITVLVWSILAVQVLHPVNKRVTESGYYLRTGCERCPHSFRSVSNSMLTIWQTVVAGDGTGELAMPIIEESPSTTIFFVFIIVSITMGITNLILAVVCDRAAEVRAKDDLRTAELEREEFEAACSAFRDKCREMDSDKSGYLNKQEIIQGFETNEDFAETMNKLGFNKGKVEFIMTAFDTDGSGRITYDEFCKSIMETRGAYNSDEAWVRDLQTMLLYVKVIVLEMQGTMRELLGSLAIDSRSPTGGETARIPLRKPFSSHNLTVSDNHQVVVEHTGDKELRDMLRTMTNKIDRVFQEMHAVADQVKAPTQSLPKYEDIEAIPSENKVGVTEVPTLHAPRTAAPPPRAVAPAPQAPAAHTSSHGRGGLAKRLSASLMPSAFSAIRSNGQDTE